MTLASFGIKKAVMPIRALRPNLDLDYGISPRWRPGRLTSKRLYQWVMLQW